MRHRSRGQTIVFAAIAMVALVGGLAMVVDTGMFFVIQRNFHSAADAGALAGAWHNPICPSASNCLTSPGVPAMVGTSVGTPPTCTTPPPVGTAPSCAPCDGTPGFAACDVALANANSVKPLCNGAVHATVAVGTTLVRPSNVNVIVVTVECDAGYSFGRILGLFTKHISASAAAAIGDRDTNGDMTDFTSNPVCAVPDQCRIARLIE
jgi:uncharacterized membrane protein